METNSLDLNKHAEAQESAGIVREVSEARNQAIKNGNALAGLAAELRDVSRKIEAQYRGTKIQAIISYAAIIVVIGGAARLIHQGRIDQLQLEKAVLRRQQASLRNELDRMRDRMERREDAETKALAFYQTLAKGQIRRAINEYPNVSRLPLSKVEVAVFSSWIQRERNQLGYGSFTEGMRAVGDGDYQKAVDLFKKSLQLLPDPPHAAGLHYYLGIALMKLGAYLEATESLKLAIAKGAEKSVSRDVRYFLASAYDTLSHREEAIRTYLEYLKRNGSTGYARVARRRIKALRK